MHQVKGANPFALTIFCPCGVVQPTCLPLMQEITGAKPVRDAIYSARGSRGIADPPDLGSGSLGRASRLAPTIFDAPKALSAMRLLGKQASLVQFRVGAPFYWLFHKIAVEPALRQVSYARCAQGSTGDCDHFASMQQPADFFCKEFLPEHHRLEAPFHLLA